MLCFPIENWLSWVIPFPAAVLVYISYGQLGGVFDPIGFASTLGSGSFTAPEPIWF